MVEGDLGQLPGGRGLAVTRARDDRGSAGRGNPAGPFSLYQRLMGRAPGYDQIQRFAKIGQVLEAGPHDTAWGLIVAQEAYLVWVQESALHTTKMMRAWGTVILALIVLVGLLVGGTGYARSVQVEEAVHRQVDEAIDRLSGQLAQQPGCIMTYGQPYCDAARVVEASVAKRQMVEAVAALSDDTATKFASFPDLPQALTWTLQLSPLQWEQIRKMSTVDVPTQKGR